MMFVAEEVDDLGALEGPAGERMRSKVDVGSAREETREIVEPAGDGVGIEGGAAERS